MTQKTKEPVRVSAGRHRSIKHLLNRRSDDFEELELSAEELHELETELAAIEAEKNGRPKTKKWVLIH